MYNGLKKITQPTSMAVTLQMNSQHICIECWFWGGGKLPIVICAFINRNLHIFLKIMCEFT